MKAPATLATFAVALAGVFALAFAAGAVAPNVLGGSDGGSASAMNEDRGSSAELRLVPERPVVSPGAAVPFRAAVLDAAGQPVRDYVRTHEKDLHLVVVSRDLSRYQHVHPTLGADGDWQVDLDLQAPGAYEAFADFRPRGRKDNVVVGTDLLVAGDYQPAGLGVPRSADTIGDIEVSLEGTPEAGGISELGFRVTRNGEPVTTLQPHLGAYGHLVSLRSGDLAYLHTHPVDEASPVASGGPVVRFGAEFPTAGTYRLFFDFRVDDEVRTADFTVEVTGAGQSPAGGSPGHGGH